MFVAQREFVVTTHRLISPLSDPAWQPWPPLTGLPIGRQTTTMATYRDAVRRLQIIYNECAPQAKDKRTAERDMDDFTRLKRDINRDVKSVRVVGPAVNIAAGSGTVPTLVHGD